MRDHTPVYIIESSIHLRAEISHKFSLLGVQSIVYDNIAELPQRMDWPLVIFIRHEASCRAQIARYCAERAPASAWVEFSCDAGFEKAVAAIRDGASDFLVWPAEPDMLERSLIRAEEDLRRARPVKVMGARAKKKVSMLTARERQVLGDVIDGWTTERIAERLSLSPRTVDIHRRNLLSKLSVRNTAQAIVVALSSGEFQPAQDNFEPDLAYA